MLGPSRFGNRIGLHDDPLRNIFGRLGRMEICPISILTVANISCAWRRIVGTPTIAFRSARVFGMLSIYHQRSQLMSYLHHLQHSSLLACLVVAGLSEECLVHQGSPFFVLSPMLVPLWVALLMWT